MDSEGLRATEGWERWDLKIKCEGGDTVKVG